MAALWIHDLNNPDKKLDHPLELIMENANHGGHTWQEQPYHSQQHLVG